MNKLNEAIDKGIRMNDGLNPKKTLTPKNLKRVLRLMKEPEEKEPLCRDPRCPIHYDKINDPIREVYNKWKSFNFSEQNYGLAMDCAMELWNAIDKYCNEK